MNELQAALLLSLMPDATLSLQVAAYRRYQSFSEFLLLDDHREMPAPLAELKRDYHRYRRRYEDLAGKHQDWLRDNGVTAISLGDSSYPALLREISRPPPLLYIRGDVNVLNLPQVAIVGSRQHSAAGAETARNFARALAASGFVVTSGMAVGIDGAAHNGALDTGTTIAVLGTGVDVVYPRRHRDLYERIIAGGGAVISEFQPGTTAWSANFPRRNRVISGLSLGVLVVEAAPRSGSLITARFGMEEGREVFAVPGSIHNPKSRGCHQLIREGAHLVETAEDIVLQLGGMLAFKSDEAEQRSATELSAEELSAEERAILEQLEFEMTDMDALINRTGLDVRELGQLLAVLEINGWVECTAGCYRRVR